MSEPLQVSLDDPESRALAQRQQFNTAASGAAELSVTQVTAFVEYMGDRLQSVPQLRPGIKYALDHPVRTRALFDQYTDLVQYITELPDDELARLTKNRPGANKDGHSYIQYRGTPSAIMQPLSPDNRAVLSSQISSACSPDSPYIDAALSDLAERTRLGSIINLGMRTLAAAGKPSSTAWATYPNIRKALWDHTGTQDPEALLHFMIASYMERYASQVLAAQGVEFAATEKNYLVRLMADVLYDKYRNGHPDFGTIFRVWSTPKHQGGLGWITRAAAKA